MKKTVSFLFTTVLFFSTVPLFAQNLTGIWRGYFITENGEQYRYEVQLDQSKKNALSGVTYSYLDTRFYGKAMFTGNYSKTSNAALVQETRTVEVKMAGGSVACIMKCRLQYSQSGREEFLEGVYTSTYEKNDSYYGVSRGGNCGGGKLFLRKVPTSDFYLEPFLRNKKPAADEPVKEAERVTAAKKPAPKAKAPKTEVVRKPVPAKPELASKPAETRPEVTKPDVTVSPKPVEPKIPMVPMTIRDRKNELIRTIAIHSREVQISLYDNGEIDGDTVSVYLDGALLLANKGLSNKPITYTLRLDDQNPEHTMTMVAENMGRIPPNTSLMIIHDGEKRYEVSITSTEQKNAMVRFRYEKTD